MFGGVRHGMCVMGVSVGSGRGLDAEAGGGSTNTARSSGFRLANAQGRAATDLPRKQRALDALAGAAAWSPRRRTRGPGAKASSPRGGSPCPCLFCTLPRLDARPAGLDTTLGSNLWRKIGSVPEEPKRHCLLNSYMLEWISALADLCGANLNILFTRQS